MSKKTFSLSITILFMFLHVSLMSQRGGPFSNDLEQICKSENLDLYQNSDKDFLRTWQEHIVVHTDKYEISRNEPLFFKAYILTGPEKVRATLSKVLRLEVLDKDGVIVITQYHRIADGMAQGVISLPNKMDEGNYRLRAYTQWMKNYGEGAYYETELVYINKKRNKNKEVGNRESLTVAFYPEGGRLIENLDNHLLIKTTDLEGNRVNIEGEIVDETGSIRIPVKYYGDGVSSVRYVPKENKEYIFKTRNGKSFVLPVAKENGYVLNVSALHPKNLAVKIHTSLERMGTNIILRGVINNVPYFEKELDVKEPDLTIDIPKEGIPAGVLEIELVGQDNTILAKRPVEIGLEHLGITITPTNGENRNAYVISVKDMEGKPVETDISLSISNINEMDNTFSKSVISDGWGTQTNTWTSANTERIMLFKKDLDIITSYDDLNGNKIEELPDNIKYPFQRGLNLYGYAYNMDYELLTNTNIQIFGISGNGVFTKEIITDGSGMIRLEDLQFEGETELVFRTTGDDTKSRLVRFEPKEETASNADEEAVKNKKEDYSEKKRGVVESSMWEPVDRDRLIELEEVVVADKKQQERKTSPSVYGVTPNRVVFQDFERPQTIPQLFLGIPGVQVIGLGTFEPQVSLPKAAGLGPVLWVLDGMPLVQPTSLFDIMSLVSDMDVERIEILFGAQASIYGTRASGGAIVIYTRSGSFLDSYNRKDANIKFQGYHDSLSFDNYLNDLDKKSRKSQNDLSTLYWNPNLRTNKSGEVLVEFKSPVENLSSLKLEAIAVTEKGSFGKLQVVH